LSAIGRNRDVSGEAFIAELIGRDTMRMCALAQVRDIALPDCWIAAGFIRDAIWDALHGRDAEAPSGDVDVIWFGAGCLDPGYDERVEASLQRTAPGFDWSVKNQARMHARNGDAPYCDATDAMRHWPETATAVGIRLDDDDRLAIAAPFGVEDLIGMILRPAGQFATDKREIFDARVASKRWLARYPRLRKV
jgi:uncharacterized protein